ncbi:transposase, partial [Lewinella lacunae]
SLLDYYAEILEQRADELLQISKYVVVDAYFSRNPFIQRVVNAGFHVVSRLRKNVSLRYYYSGPQKSKGRPKEYAGFVNLFNLDPAVFSRVEALSSPQTVAWTGVVQLKVAGLKIRIVVIHQLDEKNKIKSVKVYMSTDVDQPAEQIVHAYRCRYQQEFIFRDGKQFSGLEEGQGRDWLKIDFHVNCALTVVNLAKAAHHLAVPDLERGAFSMADITTAYTNERLALRIFSRCGIDPNLPKSQEVLAEVRNYAARAA